MNEILTITHGCGCRSEHRLEWDGRRGDARAQAVLLLDRAFPPGEPCLKCLTARRQSLAGETFTATFCDDESLVRAVVHIAKITGGTVSRSPKSLHSIYVTAPHSAWRVSDHPWPGDPASLIAEHRAGRRWVARLVPDWLRRQGVA